MGVCYHGLLVAARRLILLSLFVIDVLSTAAKRECETRTYSPTFTYTDLLQNWDPTGSQLLFAKLPEKLCFSMTVRSVLWLLWSDTRHKSICYHDQNREIAQGSQIV